MYCTAETLVSYGTYWVCTPSSLCIGFQISNQLVLPLSFVVAFSPDAVLTSFKRSYGYTTRCV
ncbi:hypothetical protein L873DRAFT_1811785 [Choiromyces venosus 120613-1]|uniref:Uncharacterized protein n=1 Tax=Choiromyces venosus 120613-1 TaxID=1336337 RepID=A0A3N4JQT1_9PEZI|nr:hypothetical protein L873DRAFT_1811785 [Choiromyces venosus 120613-1]